MLEKIINEIAKDIATIIASVLNEITQTSTLTSESIMRVVEPMKTSDGDIVYDIMLGDYIEHVENARNKRKSLVLPPIRPIVEWCKKKGIPSDNLTVYFIRLALTKQLLYGRKPILESVMEEVDKVWDGKWSDELFDKIIERLNSIFN